MVTAWDDTRHSQWREIARFPERARVCSECCENHDLHNTASSTHIKKHGNPFHCHMNPHEKERDAVPNRAAGVLKRRSRSYPIAGAVGPIVWLVPACKRMSHDEHSVSD